MKEVQYYNCQEFSHYARGHRRKKEPQTKYNEDVKYAHALGSDFDDVLLIANIQSSNERDNMWYKDLGCNNHMTANKIWFIKLDESVKKVIKFADDIHVTSGGKGNIYVVRKDGRKTNITDVLYVPLMTSYLINICQLIAKRYNMKLENY
ncbi:uncharacterized protein LOC127079512 [Lathyrus oleraceus]|uniref:uncharacterized protein LOC127079512 n=1 Tax=Pisum sativum TaxID=3888 RepID=UPI0021D01615|nr:uncharacterized protein LOC127079512 [Pisum sativum]